MVFPREVRRDGEWHLGEILKSSQSFGKGGGVCWMAGRAMFIHPAAFDIYLYIFDDMIFGHKFNLVVLVKMP